MPFFPPTLTPNNKAFIRDDKQVIAGLPRRFANYTAPVVLYWPWLSWDQTDISVLQQQSAIPRCTIVGETGYNLPSATVDTHGAIMHFGSIDAIQRWEVIHSFIWHDADVALKKFEVVWLRLWKTGAPQPPDNILPITAGVDWASAPLLEMGQAYETLLVPQGPGEFGYFMSAFQGPANITFKKIDPPPKDAGFHTDYNAPSSPTYMGTYNAQGVHVINVPTANLGLRFFTADAYGDCRIQFGINVPDGVIDLP